MSDEKVAELFLNSVRDRFRAMKKYAEGAMIQMSDEDLAWVQNPECNSAILIVQHLRGNMLSRWTDPFTTDGEKPDRGRDAEFLTSGSFDRNALMAKWEEGWGCLLGAMDSFTPDDLTKSVTIRGEGLSLVDGIERQIFHVSFHVGQIVHIAKECLGERWQTLSIPRGQSDSYRPKSR